MAQVSYGTITITDTNDIERIYTVYAKSANNTTVPAVAAANWKESISEAPGAGNYIWQRTVVQKSGTQEKTYSDPVCLTGEEGTDGKGITSITIKYGTSADWNTQPSSWYDNTPEYNSSTPNYWTQTTISYTSGNPTVKVTQDKALTQAIHDSVMANSLAQSANENANGAMGQAASNVNSVTRLWWSQATATPVPSISTIITDGAANRRGAWSNIRPTDDEAYPYYFYCDQTITGGGVASWSTVTLDTSTLSKYEINSLNVRTKNFFKGLDNSYDGWFASGRAENEGLATNNAETYHYNARFAATHIALGYNKTPIIDLDGGSGAINIYRFPTINSNTGLVTTAGALGMKLSATDLIFYKPPVGNNSPVAAAILNTNGLNFYNTSGTLTSSFGDTISLASNGASITIGSTQNEHITIDTNGLKIYGNYSYNNNGASASMYGLLGSFGDSVQIGPLNTGHITLSTTGATFYDSADTIIGVIGNTDLYYSTESYEEVVEVNWVSNETFTYDKQFNYDTNINSILVAIKNGDTIDWSSAQTATSPWGRVWINLNDTMVPISISPSAVTGRTDCIFSSTSTNPTTDTTLAFKINHTPSMPGPHYSFGIDSIAPGTGSFAAGRGIKAVGPYQTVLGRYNKKDLDASFIIGNGTDDNNRSNLFVVDGEGNLRVNNGFQIYNNDETDSIAEFGTTARIGKINSSHFLMNANSLQAYNSSNQLYFEVSNAGIRFGNNLSSTVATQADVTDASYSVEIQVTSIDYANNSATLVAIPYYQGSTTLPTGVTLSYQWYKNGNALTNTSTAPTITGATTNTLQLGEGTDFGSNTTNAIYTCVIS